MFPSSEKQDVPNENEDSSETHYEAELLKIVEGQKDSKGVDLVSLFGTTRASPARSESPDPSDMAAYKAHLNRNKPITVFYQPSAVPAHLGSMSPVGRPPLK